MKLSTKDFIALIAPIAVSLRLEGSVIFPSLRIAQAAHETGWTVHEWNNLVGFKVGSRKPNGYWKGVYVNKGTWEVYDGKRTDVVAMFRAYDTIEDCFRDQDELFKVARYDRVRAAQTPNEQAGMLQECGYATDPHYAAKLVNIMRSYDLYQYDEEVMIVLQTIEELQKTVEQQAKEINQLKDKQSMDVPDWARIAVEAATHHKIIDTPNGGSYDFYRLLVVLYRTGVIKPIPKSIKHHYPHHFS